MRSGGSAALILAAGYSSRMGAFKPLLPLGAATALEEAVQRFRAAGVDDIRVVTGHRARGLAPVLKKLRVREIFNAAYDQGMFASARAGVSSLEAGITAFFLLPVDIPLVSPRTIKDLLQAYRERDAKIIYPRFRGSRGHPPLIAAACIADLPLTWEGGLRAFLSRFDDEALDLEVVDEAVLLDCDTPEDYRRLLRYAAREGIPTRRECEAIWDRYHLPEQVRGHGHLVAGLAGILAGHLNCAELQVNVALAVAAGYLHDLAREQPDHARAGAAILENLGYSKVAPLVASHMDIQIEESSDESQLVYLADKLSVGQHLVSLEERFGRAQEKFGQQPEIMAAVNNRLQHARSIKTRLEARLGISLEDLLRRYARIPGELDAAGERRIYLVRHGAVEAPGGRRYLGHLDVPLNAAGRRQAEALREKLRQTPLAAVYCSDLQRAVETAAIIAAPHGLAPRIRRELREIDLGAWEGLTFDEVKQRYPEAYAARGRDFSHFRPPGGESFLDCAHRVLPAVHEALCAGPGQVLIVGHAGVNRILLCLAQGRSLAILFDIPQDYGCLNTLTCLDFEFVIESVNEAIQP
jgi:molybdenum cofactor cytidylyltransferase